MDSMERLGRCADWVQVLSCRNGRCRGRGAVGVGRPGVRSSASKQRHRTDWGPDQGQGVPASCPVLPESVAPNYPSAPLLQERGL